jgi:hypothetical protein
MPIKRLCRDSKIDPTQVERLDRAFTYTLRALNLFDRDDPVCEIVARKILEIDAGGTHDPEEIARLAVTKLGLP